MSFWLDDIAANAQIICHNCSGTTFYDDPITNIPTCASCFTQSQTATQEEFGEEDAYALAVGNTSIRSTATVRSGGTSADGTKKKGGVPRRPLSEYDRSRKLPSEEDCCDAFEWLLIDSVRCVAELIQLIDEDDDQSESSLSPSLETLQQTARYIWTNYRQKWREAAKLYSKRYPETRFAFRDFFLENKRKSHVMRHLSVSVGKRVEEEMIQEFQMKYRDMDNDTFFRANMEPEQATITPAAAAAVSASETKGRTTQQPPPKKKKKQRRAILTVADLIWYAFPPAWRKPVRYPNGIYEQHPYQAVMRIYPSLDLILSILQLTLTHYKLGIAPYHLTMFVANGSLSHALNGFALLSSHMQGRVDIVKNFFMRSFIPSADVIQDLTDLLATAIDWYGSEEQVDGLCLKIDPEECLYNTKLLAERMLQDFGFIKQVSINTLALMGASWSENDVSPDLCYIPKRLNYADKLYTPLHVAALIVVACKFCSDWETWNISDLGARSATDANVPWSESQLKTMQNGNQINHYVDFLENTVLSGTDAPSCHLNDFFQSLDEEIPQSIPALPTNELTLAQLDSETERGNDKQSEAEEFPTKTELYQAVDEMYREKDAEKIKLKDFVISVARHFGLNKVSKELRSLIKERIVQLNRSNRFEYVTTYDARRYKTKLKDKLRLIIRVESHPQFCQLIGYICYVMDENDPNKLHYLVADIENELFPKRNATKRTCKAEGCSNTPRGGGYCVNHGGIKGGPNNQS